jgi:hypothetical protein
MSDKINNLIKIINNQKRDYIKNRIKFIKTLLRDNKLKPIIDFDSNIGFDSENSNNSYDTRKSLNKKSFDIEEIIKGLGGKLEYIKSGSTGHTFRVICKNNEGKVIYDFAMKVCAYRTSSKYGDIHDTRRPENAELMMIKLLSQFVINAKTPHIVLPIGTFNTNITHFIDAYKKGRFHINGKIEEKKYERYKEFVNNYEDEKYHDEVSILLSEWANRGDFLDFIRNRYQNLTPMHWKVFFFQIISTLAIIQNKYPSFRHNDLKANNILVSRINEKNKKRYVYTISGDSYAVNNISYQIKLWDFDFACIPDLINNKKVNYSKWNQEINVLPEQNKYYDLHFFFNTLMNKSFFPQILDENVVPKETVEFVKSIVPYKYRMWNKKGEQNENVSKKGRLLTKDEYITPLEVLKTSPYFDEFRISSKKIRNKKKELNKVNDFLNDNKNTLSINPRLRTTDAFTKKKSKKKSNKKSKSKSKSKSKGKSKSKSKGRSRSKSNKNTKSRPKTSHQKRSSIKTKKESSYKNKSRRYSLNDLI